jgi:hypothetical protein
MTTVLLVRGIFYLAGLYLLGGIIFSCYFLNRGIGKIDKGAQGSPLSFKLIILPGVILLWPVLYSSWKKIKS